MSITSDSRVNSSSNVQQLQRPSVGGLVELEVERPHVVEPLGAQPLGLDPSSLPSLLALALAHRDSQPLLAPQALHTLWDRLPAQFPQVMMRTAHTPAPPGMVLRDPPQLGAQRRTASTSAHTGS